MNPTMLRLAQLGLTGLVFVFSVAVIGTAGHTLSVFNSQHKTNPWWIPLWTEHFDVHGTSGLITSASLALILNLAYIICAVIPAINLNGRPTMRALLSLATAGAAALVTLVTLVFAKVLNNRAPDADTIETWTCRYSQHPPSTVDDSAVTNADFSRLCSESKFAIWGTLVMFILECFIIAIAIASWILDLWTQRKEKKAWEAGEHGSMTEMNNYAHA